MFMLMFILNSTSLLVILHLTIISSEDSNIPNSVFPTSTSESESGGTKQHEIKISPTGNLQFLYTKVRPEIQEIAARLLIQRLIPTRQNEFEVKIDPSLTSSVYQDAFSIQWNNNTQKVSVSGTSGVAISFGFHHYLKYYCQCHVSWEGVQLNIPHSLPQSSIRKVILDRFRHYENACTDSYSFVWWNWTQWESEIDWMALNGINLPLASVGQEAIWFRVFLELGLSRKDIEEYMSGPAFLAWWRMGNLQKWGGPISQHFLSEKLKLLHQILVRMRSFGMLPILPAFSGTVPNSLKKLYPNSTFTRHESWSHFNSTYTPYFLDPTDPLFQDIGKRFLNEMTKEFGTDHVYSCDTFNENRPSKNDTGFLAQVAEATFQSMTAGDLQAVWVMQAWVFNYDPTFWSTNNVRSYLGGVGLGNLMLLDLQADVNPGYVRFESYYGHHFIWCMLQNFGGASVLFGTMELINVGVPVARNLSKPGSLIGVGMTPEGIAQNYVMYDFMSEMTLSDSPVETQSWIQKYAQRRYGVQNDLLEQSWLILEAGVYNAFPWIRSNAHTIIGGRPGLNRTEPHWYKLTDISTVVDNFLTAASEPNNSVSASTLFRHDLVDFTRQFLQHAGELIYIQLLKAYYSQNVTLFTERSEQFLDVLSDLDKILSTSTHFLAGTWVKAAESWGQTQSEMDMLRFNSLNQITLWGPTGEIVDYAVKQWSGLISNYNHKRWSFFLQHLNSSLITREPFNSKAFNRNVLEQIEIPFTYSPSSCFPDEPEGDSLIEAHRIYKKWKRTFQFCLRNPFKYDKRPRGRGQKNIRKSEYNKSSRTTGKNKKFAHFYAASIGLFNASF